MKARLWMAVVALMAAGCRGAPQRADSPLARVEVGMEARQVEAVAGRPAAVERELPLRQLWYYRDGVVILNDGRVEFVFPQAAGVPGAR